MRSAWICFASAPYTHRAAVGAARAVLEPAGWKVVASESVPENGSDGTPHGHDAYVAEYDLLPFDTLLGSSTPCSSYVIRKALIRKHYLAHALHAFAVKHRGSGDALRDVAPRTWTLDVQFADELDELLADDLYDLHEQLSANEARRDAGQPLQWYILKPGMADQGNGIRLFASEEQLRAIFEEFEPDSESEEEAAEQGEEDNTDTAVVASQLRHFVVQEYLTTPLLVGPPDSARKFHLRAYVICVGALHVFLHDDMLALFATQPYTAPDEQTHDLGGHLTNTCLGTRQARGSVPQENVFRFAQLEQAQASVPLGSRTLHGTLTPAHMDRVRRLAAQAVGTTFEAAARSASVHWQMWPNAFEVFGVDLLVGCDAAAEAQEGIPLEALRVWLLEVNAVCAN